MASQKARRYGYDTVMILAEVLVGVLVRILLGMLWDVFAKGFCMDYGRGRAREWFDGFWQRF